MEFTALATVVQKYMDGLDPKIIRALRDVQLIVGQTVADAQSDLNELLADVELEEGESKPVLLADSKGLFFGDPLETEQSDEDPEEETVYDPDGVIVLIADNIADETTASLVLSHEIGHALGMDEDEVKALGLGTGESKPHAQSESAPTAHSEPLPDGTSV